MEFSKVRRVISKGSITLIATLLVVVVVFPIVWMVTSSLRPYALLFSPTLEIIPANPTLDAFGWVLLESDFFLWMKNSLMQGFGNWPAPQRRGPLGLFWLYCKNLYR